MPSQPVCAPGDTFEVTGAPARRSHASAALALQEVRRAPRKRVVVFTVTAGGGHMAAAEAIRRALVPAYDVDIVRPIENGTREYNQMMAMGWNGVLNMLGSLQDIAEQTVVPWTSGHVMGGYLDTLRPDLLISVLPCANQVAWNAAKERNIPMLLVPTDLRLNHFVKSINQIDSRLKVALPFADDSFVGQVGTGFQADNLVPIGYPVRPEFTNAAEPLPRSLVDELRIAPQDKVVLMMAGANGGASNTVKDDVRTLLMGLRGRAEHVHLVCFCGRNDGLRAALPTLAHAAGNPDVTVHALGFTDAAGVSALMRRAHVILTKSGGGTVNEALALKLPMLFRKGGEQLWWEQGNSDFVTSHGLGAWTDGGAQLLGSVSEALRCKRPTLNECPARDFGRNLRTCVDALVKPAQVEPLQVPPAPITGRKRRALILSSDAGSGHAAAARAVQRALGAAYETVVERPYDMDMAMPTVGAVRGVDFYNMVQAHGPPIVLDLLGGFQRLAAPMGDTLHGPALRQLMEQHTPDVVISVVPMGHGTAYKEAQARQIPMVVVPTDLDFAHFVDQIPKGAANFKLALPFATMRTQAPHLSESAFAVTGYPVREEFCGVGEPSGVLQDLGIAARDKVVMIMMGGGGTSSDRVQANAELLVSSLHQVMRLQAPVHVVCVCGRNTAMRTALQTLSASNRTAPVRVHALGQCEAGDVAALMGKADVLITKPGGATVNEALLSNVRQVYDRSVHAPFWELGNAAFAEQHQVGTWVDSQTMVQHVAQALTLGRPSQPLDNPSRQFPQHLKALVDCVTNPSPKGS